MSSKVIIIPDPHAHPDFNNERADWIGELIADEKPNKVICLGDLADMPSLCSYDKNTREFSGRSYAKDIESAVEFQDRMWHRVRKRKKRKPASAILIGNHEQRIDRALDMSPELEGTISYSDLQYHRYFDDVVYYEGMTPGVYEDRGVHYSHYFVSGAMGRAISGEHSAYTLLTKKFTSCTVGHDHRLDYCIRTRGDGKKIMGLVAGVGQDYHAGWAGTVNDLWWSGVVIKDNLENGCYDLRAVSMDRLRKEYKGKLS